MRTSDCRIVVLAATQRARATHPVPFRTLPTKPNHPASHSVYKGDWQYMVGGGVAAFDCNGDGFPDLFIAGGENKAKLFLNKSAKGGALKFEEAKDTGLELDHVTGAYPIDIDGDGDHGSRRAARRRKHGDEGPRRLQVRRQPTRHGMSMAAMPGTRPSRPHGKRATSCPHWPLAPISTASLKTIPGAIAPTIGCCAPMTTQDGYGPRIALTPSYCALSMLFTDWNRSGTPVAARLQ